MSRKTTVKAYTLRIELQDIESLVWRRLLVDGDTTLSKLHHYILRVSYMSAPVCPGDINPRAQFIAGEMAQ